jgi:exopolysaccharide biosynthesis protein
LLFLTVAEWASPRLILEELAKLGARDAMLLDGGSSSAMAIGKDSQNITSQVLLGGWRPVATFFGVKARPVNSP